MRPVARDRQAATDCGGRRDGHNGSDKAYRLWTINSRASDGVNEPKCNDMSGVRWNPEV